MSAAYVHLLLNHVPVLGLFGGLLLLAWGVSRRSRDLTVAGLAFLVLAALVTIPVYLSGEPAEEIVEGLPGVSEHYVEEHEEAGKWALIALEATGLLALVSLFATRKAAGSRTLPIATLLLGIFAMTVVVRTAMLGGEIRHTEIRGGAAATAPAEVEDDD